MKDDKKVELTKVSAEQEEVIVAFKYIQSIERLEHNVRFLMANGDVIAFDFNSLNEAEKNYERIRDAYLWYLEN